MLFPIFVVATILELYVIITVGGAIGSLNTVGLVIATAFIGTRLLKQQGFSILQKAQQSIAQGNTPSFEMLEGVIVMVSGILLLTPGFITDFVGLLGLMPWSRQFFLKHILEKNASKIFGHSKFTNKNQQPKNGINNTIEGEFWED